MKNINLIKTVPASRQHEIRQWTIFSVTLLAGIFGTITFFEIPQLRAWYTVKKEKENLEDAVHAFESIMDKKHELKQKETGLTNRVQKLERCTKNPKNPVNHMTMVMQASEQTVHLDGVSIHKNTMKITAACSKPADATNFVKRLQSTKQAQDVTLASMHRHQQHEQNLQFTVHATV